MSTLKALIKDDKLTSSLRARVTFSDFTFEIRYMSRAAMRELGQRCITHKWNPKEGKRSPEVDYEKLAKEFSDGIIVDWEGVTLRKLVNFIPLEVDRITPEQWDAPISFDKEDLRLMLQYVLGLENFLQDSSTDLSLFQTANLEGELGNSNRTPSGTSTPTT